MAATTGASPNTSYHQGKDTSSGAVTFINFHENFTNTYAALTSPQIIPAITKEIVAINTLDSKNYLQNGKITNNNNNNANSVNKMAINLVEKVHNYSKLYDVNNAKTSTVVNPPPLDLRKLENSTDDYDDGEASGDETEEAKTLPDHHARRPMNAFLMFCKRHRAIVKERYPNLENRSITKILGDWWGSLDAKDKSEFKGLANEYKTEFLDKNKSFQWYKLPAPPLRTLSTRPGNLDRPSIVCIAKAMESFGKSTKSSNYQSDKQQNRARKTSGNMVGMFKLADEAQMGGLSSLMSCGDAKPKSMDNDVDPKDFDYHGIDSNEASSEPLSNMRSHAEKMESEYAQMTLLKRDQSSSPFNAEHFTFDKDAAYIPTGATTPPPSTDSSGIRRSSRACKGKRYKEFMSNAVTGITRSPSSNKKKRMYESFSSDSTDSQDNDDLSNHHQNDFTHSSSSSIMMMDYEPTDHMYASLDQSLATYHQQQRTLTASPKSLELPTSSSLSSSSKPFGAMDYNLEKKILELPAMDLDKYLSRKRDTKHKKKITTVRRPMNIGAARVTTQSPTSSVNTTKIVVPAQTIEEARERIKAAVMVGSQKRKARKESITRRVSESTATTTGVIDYDMVNVSPQPVVEPTTSASSLFMLATIAEVAANLSDSK